MGFFQRNRASLVEKGIEPTRLPPGQYVTDRVREQRFWRD